MNAEEAPEILSQQADLSASIECEGRVHVLKVRGGTLEALAHDLEAEATLSALGSDSPACLAVAHAWRRAGNADLACLLGGRSFRNPRRHFFESPDGVLARLFHLPEVVRHRCVVSALVSEGLRRGRFRQWPASDLFELVVFGRVSADIESARAVLVAGLWMAGADATQEALALFAPHVFSRGLTFPASRELRRPMLEAVVSLMTPEVRPSMIFKAIHVNAHAMLSMLMMESMVEATPDGWKVLPRNQWTVCSPGILGQPDHH